MSGHNDGGPAFPANFTFKSIDHIPCGEIGEAVDVTWHLPGMTLRDYFAAKAMTAMSLKSDAAYSQEDRRRGCPETEARWAAIAAYRYADAMLAVRGAA